MIKALQNKIESIKGVKCFGDWVRIDGVLYPLPLVDGNDKIGDVWHASTLPTDEIVTADYNGGVISEKGTCPITCKDDDGCVTCYGTKGNYNYESTKFYLIMRTRFLRQHRDIYFMVARYQIETQKINMIRLHATGDFIPGEAAGWYEIFKDYPYLIGWTYTKCAIRGDIEMLNSLNNFNIVPSCVPGFGFNYGHISYVLKVWAALKRAGKKVYICRCGIDKKQHCDNCTACSQNDYVLFIEHSTAYKAVKDRLYNLIKMVINAQPQQLRQL